MSEPGKYHEAASPMLAHGYRRGHRVSARTQFSPAWSSWYVPVMHLIKGHLSIAATLKLLRTRWEYEPLFGVLIFWQTQHLSYFRNSYFGVSRNSTCLKECFRDIRPLKPQCRADALIALCPGRLWLAGSIFMEWKQRLADATSGLDHGYVITST